MNRKLYRHPRALSDIEDSAIHIGAHSVRAALRFLDAVEATMRLLLDNPEVGRVRTFEVRDLCDVRSFRVEGFDNHLVFYRRIEEGIEVLRVLHGARDLDATIDE